jgi:hypothetical protein
VAKIAACKSDFEGAQVVRTPLACAVSKSSKSPVAGEDVTLGF